ncbi:preprotein translocase subunit SecA [Pseudothermotoga sp. U03pept]|uniref:preprotein translocase subunit SecA n=1 Tax=Pseudothermotoga sp. U03pept TaxID=3447012 RepID=UPI003F04BA47
MALFDRNKMLLKKYFKTVERIKEVEKTLSKATNHELIDLSEELKKTEDHQESLFTAFALARVVAKRVLGMYPFDVQVVGGLALNEGKVAEMKTGEGKTLAATMPLFFNALAGRGVHLVTVNDYLARRDALWMGPLYLFLGLRVGVINQLGKSYEVVWKDKQLFEEAIRRNLSIWPDGYVEEFLKDTAKDQDAVEAFAVELVEIDRKQAYQCDIIYGTNNEFGFDYLRDNLILDLADKVQRGHFYAIIDEVDSILIDEARTPLIISGPSREGASIYKRFASLAKRLTKDTDFTVDEKSRTVVLTENGIEKAEKLLGVGNLYDPSNVNNIYHLTNALKALHLFKKDVDYVIMNQEIIIVDEFTGRLLPGRRYSGGLHQAIEAKEGVPIKEESITYATITFQNYFKMYEKLAGMTGTAKTEEEEFKQLYDMEVVVIPTHKPMIRKDHDDLIYRTQAEKYTAVVNDVVERYKKGQPVLIGTTSIEKSELLSSMLKKMNIPHQVLNAKYHEKEAQIIALAGQKGAVTIATNMAGRGTDIKLGEGVTELGGLCIIGTERHESRRIDNQLRGRSGRQGDPGESRFYLSLEDDLLRIFGKEQLEKVMNVLKIKPGEPIEHPLLTRLIETVQKRVEGINFSIRKHLMEMDTVLDAQRRSIYSYRDWILSGKIEQYVDEAVQDFVERRLEEFCNSSEWNVEGLKNSLSVLPKGVVELDGIKEDSVEKLKEFLISSIRKAYERKREEIGEEYSQFLKFLVLRIIDDNWRQYLEEVEHVKEAVNLRAYGQRDPIVEFKRETYALFDEMMARVNELVVSWMLRVVKVDKQQAEQEAKKDLARLQLVHEEFDIVNRSEKRKLQKGEKIKKRFKIKR